MTRAPLGVVIGSSLDHDPLTPELGPRDDLVVLRRHGPLGSVPAHLVDHAATVAELVGSGCDRVLAVGSCGGLQPGRTVPGSVVVIDDYFAPAGTPTSFETTEGYGVRAIDPVWRGEVLEAWTASSDRPVLDGGTYAQTRGPRFETPAEVRWLAGCADVVGMTLASELVLAAEAGLAYAAVCQVDNLAAGLGESPSGDVAVDYLAATSDQRDRLAAELVAVVRSLLEGVSVTSG